MPAAAVKERKTYYSSAAALVERVTVGEHIPGDHTNRLGEKLAEFSPIGARNAETKFGMLVTDDPDKIAHLDAAIASGRDDIFDEAEYHRRTIPPEQRAKSAEQAVADLQRTITAQNALIAKLQAEGRLPASK